jgi:hypothetical protein
VVDDIFTDTPQFFYLLTVSKWQTMTWPKATLKSLLRKKWEMGQLAELTRDGLAESHFKGVLLKVFG